MCNFSRVCQADFLQLVKMLCQKFPRFLCKSYPFIIFGYLTKEMHDFGLASQNNNEKAHSSQRFNWCCLNFSPLQMYWMNLVLGDKLAGTD